MNDPALEIPDDAPVKVIDLRGKGRYVPPALPKSKPLATPPPSPPGTETFTLHQLIDMANDAMSKMSKKSSHRRTMFLVTEALRQVTQRYAIAEEALTAMKEKYEPIAEAQAAQTEGQGPIAGEGQGDQGRLEA